MTHVKSADEERWERHLAAKVATGGERWPGEREAARRAEIAEWNRQHAIAHGSYLDDGGQCVACLGQEDADYKRRADL